MTQLFHLEKLTRPQRERVFYAVVSVLGRPSSYLEVACGDGWLVRAAKQIMCKPAIGVGSRIDHANGRHWAAIVVRDVTEPFQFDGQFGLVASFTNTPHVQNLERFVAPTGRLVTIVRDDIGLECDREATEALERILGPKSYEVYKCRD